MIQTVYLNNSSMPFASVNLSNFPVRRKREWEGVGKFENGGCW
jgi:hypothetical protein